MRLVFICSPLRDENIIKMKANILAAERYCRDAVMAGYNPVAPHVFYTRFLDEMKPEERSLGIKAGLDMLLKCDYIWVYKQYGITAGMEKEIALATLHNIPIVYKDKGGQNVSVEE